MLHLTGFYFKKDGTRIVPASVADKAEGDGEDGHASKDPSEGPDSSNPKAAAAASKDSTDGESSSSDSDA